VVEGLLGGLPIRSGLEILGVWDAVGDLDDL